MTGVEGRCRRQISPGSFSDITTATVLDIGPCAAGTAVTFDAELDAATVLLVQRRMDSTGPVDEAKRSALFADCDALAEGDPLRRLYGYVLGE